MKRENLEPMELNEENVDLLFDRCFAPEGNAEDQDNFVAVSPFSEELGYDEDSPMVFFRKETALKNKNNILYLLGQLKDIENKKYLRPDDFYIKADGIKWTEDKEKAMKLIYLTDTAPLDIISIFINLDFSNSAKIIKPIEKTLSPTSEDFEKWYENF